MIIIKFPFLLKLHTLAFTFFPFIFVRDEKIKNNAITMNHEKIHAMQQIEMMITTFVLLFIPFPFWFSVLFSLASFYIWYYTEYLIRAIGLGSFSEAYYKISFEMEAYSNERNMQYRKERIVWAFLKYIS